MECCGTSARAKLITQSQEDGARSLVHTVTELLLNTLHVVLTIVLSVQFYQHGHHDWFCLTLSFLLTGLLLQNVLIFFVASNIVSPTDETDEPASEVSSSAASDAERTRFHKVKKKLRSIEAAGRKRVDRTKRKVKPVMWVVCILQLGPIYMDLEAVLQAASPLRHPTRSHPSPGRSNLRMIEAFTHAAPLLLLLSYVGFRCSRDADRTSVPEASLVITWMTSLLVIAWAMTSFHCDQREQQKKEVVSGPVGPCLIFLWHTFTISTRALALAFFVLETPIGFTVFAGLHFFGVHSWLIVADQMQSGGSMCASVFIGLFLSPIYMFTFLVTFSGRKRSRLQYAVFHCSLYAENVAMSGYAHYLARWSCQWCPLAVLVVVVVGYPIGVLFQVIFYSKYHPDNKETSVKPHIKPWAPLTELSLFPSSPV